MILSHNSCLTPKYGCFYGHSNEILVYLSHPLFQYLIIHVPDTMLK